MGKLVGIRKHKARVAPSRLRPPMAVPGATEVEILKARLMSMRQLLYAFMLEREDPEASVTWKKEDLICLNPDELKIEVRGPDVCVRLEQQQLQPNFRLPTAADLTAVVVPAPEPEPMPELD